MTGEIAEVNVEAQPVANRQYDRHPWYCSNCSVGGEVRQFAGEDLQVALDRIGNAHEVMSSLHVRENKVACSRMERRLGYRPQSIETPK